MIAASSIIIAGDVCPHKGIASVGMILDGVRSIFEAADAAVVNLECPLTASENRLDKTGPCLQGDPVVAKQLKDSGVTLCAMANNHIMDAGEQGLFDTLTACKQAGLLTIGVGENQRAARTHQVIDLGQCRIGVIACAENEWSIAGRETPGAYGLDMPNLLEDIRLLKNQVDGIVVLMHAGREHYPYPYPKLQHWCRHMIRAGASAVFCQHSHCMGAFEEYDGGFISYGQGNLVFPPVRGAVPQTWFEGYLVKLFFKQGQALSWKLIPYRTDPVTGLPSLVEKSETDKVTTRLEEMSALLQSPSQIEESWREIVVRDEGAFLTVLAGGGRYMRGLGRRWPVIKRWYSHPKRRLLLNMIRCEAIREAYLAILDR